MLVKAKELLEERQNRNEAVDLADCLQLSDKFDLIAKKNDLLSSIGISKTKLNKLKESSVSLRNRLAHGQDLVTGTSWEKIIYIATNLEELLQQLENLVE